MIFSFLCSSDVFLVLLCLRFELRALRLARRLGAHTPLSRSLRDQDLRVKKNALMVLMHLILNDMIKVKGQIFEMAICIESEVPI